MKKLLSISPPRVCCRPAPVEFFAAHAGIPTSSVSREATVFPSVQVRSLPAHEPVFVRWAPAVRGLFWPADRATVFEIRESGARTVIHQSRRF